MQERFYNIIYPINDNIQFNFSSGELINVEGQAVSQLTQLQGVLFQAFVTNPDIVLGVNQLERIIYPEEVREPDYNYGYFGKGRVHTLVARVRKQLEPAGLDKQLKTLRGRGYMWKTGDRR